MLACQSFRPLPSELRVLRRSGDVTPSIRCCSLPDNKAKRRKDVPKAYHTAFHFTHSGSGDLNVNFGEAKGKVVQWDAVAISPEAKVLLQQHGVKASTALKMYTILGLEDMGDVQRLVPDLLAQLKLKPLQLQPLLDMLREYQGDRQPHKPLRATDPAGGFKPLEHSGVYYLAISPDGRSAITHHEDYDLEIWDLTTCARTATMEGHDDGTFRVAITRDGRRAVSVGNASSNVLILDLDAHACTATLEGHTGYVSGVAITPDGRCALSCGEDKTLRLWDLDACTCVSTLEGHTDWVRSVAVTPDGRKAVSGGNDCTLRVWDLATRRCIASMEGHTGIVFSVAVTPDGRQAVSGSADETLRVWDLDTYACAATLEGHTDEVTCVAVTPDGRYTVSGSNDTTMRLWDLSTHTCAGTLEGHEHEVTDLVITPDGRYAVASTNQYTSRVWDLVHALSDPMAKTLGVPVY